MSEERAVADLISQAEEKDRQGLWKDINGDSITNFLFTLDKNLGENKARRKELSRYGALRLGADAFLKEAQLTGMEIWRAVVNNQEFYLATKYPMSSFYASWIYHVAREQNVELQYHNCERLGDLVETRLGVLYLATIFSQDLSEIVTEPGIIPRKMETSMTAK
jgi:hypothetical protein